MEALPDPSELKQKVLQTLSSQKEDFLTKFPEVERLPVMRKSPFDKREFEILRLPNQMNCIFIQDKDLKQSMCALHVAVGSLEDYKGYDGMAHFLEHMLYLGSEAYPDANEYGTFFSENGGDNNAWTEDKATVYHFQTQTSALQEGMDRTASFFISPLMDQKFASKEVNAVHSEYEGNVTDDDWRCEELQINLANPDSYYHNFGTGNKVSLDKPNIHAKLRAFYDQFYSANVMTLVLQTSLDFSEMLTLSLNTFGKIYNKDLTKPSYADRPFPFQNRLQKLVHYERCDEENMITLKFLLKSLMNHYKTGSIDYITSLIQNKKEGSIYQELVKLDYGTEIEADYNHTYDAFTELNIHITLTELGNKNQAKVVSIVGLYLAKMREKGVCKWIWEEQAKSANIEFQFMDPDDPEDFVSSFCENIGMAPLEDLLAMDYLYEEYRPDIIHRILESMNPENLVLLVASDDYTIKEKNKSLTKISKIEYEIKDLPSSFVKALEVPDASWYVWINDIKNPYIPTEFTIRANEIERDQQFLAKTYPQDEKIIKQIASTEYHYNQQTQKEASQVYDGKVHHFYNEEFSIHYQLDTVFRVPKFQLKVAVHIDNYSGYSMAAKDQSVEIWTRLMNQGLSDIQDFGEEGNLEVELSYQDSSTLLFCLQGFSQNFLPFLEKFFEIFKSINVTDDKDKFESIRADLESEYDGEYKEVPSEIVSNLHSVLMDKDAVDARYLSKTVEKLTFDKFCQNIKYIWTKIHFECFVSGNLLVFEVMQGINIIKAGFMSHAKFTPRPREQITRWRAVHMSVPHSTVIYQDVCEEEKNELSSIGIYYMVPDKNQSVEFGSEQKASKKGKGKAKNKKNDEFVSKSENKSEEKDPFKRQTHLCKIKVMLHLLNQLQYEKFYAVLRTEKQLGYTVGTNYDEYLSQYYIEYYVQGDKLEINEVAKHIYSFIENDLSEQLKNLTEEQFQKAKEATGAELTGKFTSLYQRATYYWESYIDRHHFIEDMKALTAKIIKELTLADFQMFLFGVFIEARKVLEIQVVSEKKQKVSRNALSERCREDKSLILIKNIRSALDQAEFVQDAYHISMCPPHNQ